MAAINEKKHGIPQNKDCVSRPRSSFSISDILREEPRKSNTTTSGFSSRKKEIDHTDYKTESECSVVPTEGSNNAQDALPHSSSQTFQWLQCTRYNPPKVPSK